MEAANGGNPAKLAAKLFNSSQSAVKEAQKTMSKRKFTERDKKPRGDLAVEVVALSDELKKVATPEPGQKRGLYEAAVADMDFDKGSSASMEEVNRAFARKPCSERPEQRAPRPRRPAQTETRPYRRKH